jgi:hypothetical protein
MEDNMGNNIEEDEESLNTFTNEYISLCETFLNKYQKLGFFTPDTTPFFVCKDIGSHALNKSFSNGLTPQQKTTNKSKDEEKIKKK